MREIRLTQGFVTLVDAEDYEAAVTGGPWHLANCDGKLYAQRHRGRTAKDGRGRRLHTFLTGYSLTDHANGNGLDNRRSNLRPATWAENHANSRKPGSNTSGFKGVGWHKSHSAWRAYIGYQGKHIHLGYFSTAEAAAGAYDAAARDLYGEFALPNFPESLAVPHA
jgi:hypothetical protein